MSDQFTEADVDFLDAELVDADCVHGAIGPGHVGCTLACSRCIARKALSALAAAGRLLPPDEGMHVVEFRETGWTISHPLSCRPRLFDCPVNRAAERDLTEPPDELGRFECDIDDAGRLLIGDRGAVSDGE